MNNFTFEELFVGQTAEFTLDGGGGNYRRYYGKI